VHTGTIPEQVRHMTDRAVRIAIAERRVTAMVFPNDLQDLDYEEPPRAHGTLHSGIGYRAPRVVPNDRDQQQAADLLNAGKKVAGFFPAAFSAAMATSSARE
jgi:pyruvate dehydrogenase (quinone)